MNAAMILGLLSLALAGGLAWALLALSRAHTELAVARDRLGAPAGAVPAHAAEAPPRAADEMIKRAAETFKPVGETLARFQEQVVAAEKARAEEAGGLKAQIAALIQASAATQTETRKLSAALRRGAGVQGRWGEQTLRNVLEAAGLAKRFDFEEQYSVEGGEGRRRPDVKVRMPGGGVFVIDAKCSLNAFLEAQDAAEDALRDAAFARHAASVRGHIAGLSAKAYWDQFKAEGSPDFVAMFVPGDGFLAAALDRAPDLMTEAMDRRVLVVTPTTLFALCKAVAYGWRVEEQAKGAQQIADLGRELYKRIAVLGEHAQRLGKSLDDSVKRYNQFAGSLETQVLTQARRVEELSVDHKGRSVPELTPVETGVRELTKLASEMRGPERGPERGDAPILTLKSVAPTSAA